MGSLNPEDDPKQELNDSGYVQEDTSNKTMSCSEYKGSACLLDLSDDVLLYILQYCKPQDLKALGYSCLRLGSLILDRTLWQRVDARDSTYGKKRMMWLLTHGLSEHTNALLLSGYAKKTKGCLGYINTESRTAYAPHQSYCNISLSCVRNEILRVPALRRYSGGFLYWPQKTAENQNSTSTPKNDSVKCLCGHSNVPEPPTKVRKRSDSESEADGSRDTGSQHTGSEEAKRIDNESKVGKSQDNGSKMGNCPRCETKVNDCPGLLPTVTPLLLSRLQRTCVSLTELALEYCLIDCADTTIKQFPSTLKKLSLRGTTCYNMDRTFLSKIHDGLPLLEELDVSICEWLEPSCMMVLGKMDRLSTLLMQRCPRMCEFVAYASLATRYGFKNLKVFDLRGTPVDDAEVSALGWLPKLEELYLSPATPKAKENEHMHSSTKPKADFKELDDWELDEPEYFKYKSCNEDQKLLEDSGNSESRCAFRMDNISPQLRADLYGQPAGMPSLMSNCNSDHDMAPAAGNSSKSTDEDTKTKNTLKQSPETDAKRKNTDSSGIEAGPLKRQKMSDPCATKASLKYFDDSASKSDDGKDHHNGDKSSKYEDMKSDGDSNDDDSNDDDDDPRRANAGSVKVNQGASTSKDAVQLSVADTQPSSSTSKNVVIDHKYEKNVINIFVRLRQESSNSDSQQNNNDGNEPNLNRDEEAPGPSGELNDAANQDFQLLCNRMRSHCARVFRINMPVINDGVEPRPEQVVQAPADIDANMSYATGIEYASMVTDTSIRRFGRADGDIIQYVQIGPGGPIPIPFRDPQARPNRSNLRILSVTGFTNITNVSLTHLITAAPHLELLDVTGTRVTEIGVQHFRNLRSNCEVRYGPKKPENDASKDNPPKKQ